MTQRCDHTSVGVLIWKDHKLLLIERRNPPFGFAPPAGHVDKDDASFEEAAKRELKEEVGLESDGIYLLIEGRKNNPCRREDEGWHYWKIYEAKARGNIKEDKEETKQVNWYTKEDIAVLVKKTERYLIGDVSEEKWEQSPGLEPVWHEWLKALKII